MNPIRQTFSLVELLLTAATIAMLSTLLLPQVAKADSQSFNTTNTYPPAVDMRAFPNSGNATNYTGGWIDVRGYRSVGIAISGQPSTTNNGAINVMIVGSTADNPPGTNDWNQGVVSAGPTGPINLSAPVTAFTNAGVLVSTRLNWSTNLDETFIGQYNWLGIFNITNTMAAGTFTNASTKVIKRIIPFRFPN